jgi:G:T-mismatch repair DNA endonuclease (very short patch repair protein)
VNSLRDRALTLQSKTGLSTHLPLTIHQLAKFEEIIDAKIAVVHFDENSFETLVTQCSERQNERVIFLYLTDGHYNAIVNPNGLWRNRKICFECFKIIGRKCRSHICKGGKERRTCLVCENDTCIFQYPLMCNDCNLTCRNKACFERHKQIQTGKNREDGVDSERSKKSMCEKRKKCKKCGKIVLTKEQNFNEHICGQYKCTNCQEFVDNDHLCFLRRKKMKTISGKMMFADFECTQDSVIQCEKGYTAKGRKDGCLKCTVEHTCSNCRLCVNCKSPSCGRNEHKPNLLVSQSSCDKCKEEKLLPGAKCKECGNLCYTCFELRKKGNLDDVGKCSLPSCCEREVIFSGESTASDFCKWLLSPMRDQFTVLFHNARNYDSNFILNYCVSEAKIRPKIIYSGCKILYLEINEDFSVRVLDSLSFMQMKLSKLVQAFDLTLETEVENGDKGLKKGDFPHKLNKSDMQNYKGEWPSLDAYDVDLMQESERESFISWHSEQQGKVFDLQKELLEYCRIDVTILRLACMKFRDLIMDITTVRGVDGEVTCRVDPFAHITVASMTMQIFRHNFMEEHHDVILSDGRGGTAVFKGGEWELDGEIIPPQDICEKKFVMSSIAQTPAQGYVRTSKHSKKSIAWLEYKASKLGREIIHARNKGEKVMFSEGSRFPVDGFDPHGNDGKGVIYMYHGCFWHGHDCISQRDTTLPNSRFSMDDLQRMTKSNIEKLKKLGHEIVEIYECEFDKQIRESQEISDFVSKLDVPERMSVRQAFYGGRTCGFKLHEKCNEDERIQYYDVVSLYPFICKSGKFPLGHPEIITHDFDTSMKSYFGIAHVKILPPKNLYVPVLPYRSRGKLIFPLCKSCIDSENVGECNHCDDERALIGVWCTPEIMTALDSGYKIVKIYEVYHYSKSAQIDCKTGKGGLFSEHVNLFIKLKTEASGFPEWVKTEEDKVKFVKEFKEKVGVDLEIDKIKPNQALRSICKIILNSFWGKLGQQLQKPKVEFVSSVSELHDLQKNTKKEIKDFHIVNADVVAVEYVVGKEFLEDSNISSEILAAFTTSHARLELLKHMRSVGRAILYSDTDSIIFKARIDDEGKYICLPETGTCLGELSNELKEGEYIEEFACTGPKSYSYRTNTKKEIVRFKGITLNFKNSQRINFDAVKELVFDNQKSVTLEPRTQFCKIKYVGTIYNAELTKTVKCTFDKRKILKNFDTVPFGYHGE